MDTHVQPCFATPKKNSASQRRPKFSAGAKTQLLSFSQRRPKSEAEFLASGNSASRASQSAGEIIYQNLPPNEIQLLSARSVAASPGKFSFSCSFSALAASQRRRGNSASQLLSAGHWRSPPPPALRIYYKTKPNAT